MTDGNGVELQIQLVEQRSQIALTAQSWNELVARNETNTIFQSYQWFDAWWKAFGAGCHLYFLQVRREATIVGFVAFVMRRTTLGLRQLELAGTGNADYLDFVLTDDKPAAIRAICEFMAGRRCDWDRIRLCNVPAQSSTLACVAMSSGVSGLHFATEAYQHTSSLQLAGNDARVRALLGKYSMRRPLNWFSRHGDVRFRHVTDLAEIESMLPVFFDQHVRRWRAAGKPSLFEQEEQRAFYLELARSTHAMGWLQFSVVEFKGGPIAFHFGFDYECSVLWYKPSFELRYAEHSPGLLLTRQLIEDAVERGRREIDFTIGEEDFKERFVNAERRNVYIGVYRTWTLYAAVTAVLTIRRILGRAWRRIRGAGKSRKRKGSKADRFDARATRAA